MMSQMCNIVVEMTQMFVVRFQSQADDGAKCGLGFDVSSLWVEENQTSVCVC